jgi:hypothetical protein
LNCAHPASQDTVLHGLLPVYYQKTCLDIGGKQDQVDVHANGDEGVKTSASESKSWSIAKIEVSIS